MKTGLLLAGIAVGVIFLIVIGQRQQAQTQSAETAELRGRMEENATLINRTFESAKEMGLIADARITGEYPEIFVTGVFDALLLKKKQEFALSLYLYCLLHNPSTEVVYIKNAYSGKTIGTFAKGLGLELR